MKTFDDFYEFITGEERCIVDSLRQIVLSTSPKFIEKISYQVPYYFIHSRVCYIWPASVHSGPKAGVVLGFCKGQLISDEYNLLEKEGRKEIATIPFLKSTEINSKAIMQYIHQAILLDEETVLKKRF